MLALSGHPRIFVCKQVTDMRCSFSGLTSRAKHIMAEDPLSGHLFVFFNKRRDYTKILYWDESGYCIWGKRLEAGTFEVPAGKGCKLEINRKKLMLILEGISLQSARERKRFLLKQHKQ